jgi:hypothetical protein
MSKTAIQQKNTLLIYWAIAIYYLIIGVYSLITWLKHTSEVSDISLLLIASGFVGYIWFFFYAHVDEWIGNLLIGIGLFTAGLAYGTSSPGRFVLFFISCLIQIRAIFALIDVYKARRDYKFNKKFKQRFSIFVMPKKLRVIIATLVIPYLFYNTIKPHVFNNLFFLYTYFIIGAIFIIASFTAISPIERAVELLFGCSFVVMGVGTSMQTTGDNILYYTLPSLFMLISVFIIENQKSVSLKVKSMKTFFIVIIMLSAIIIAYLLYLLLGGNY